ncbi:MAG: hypothetical protein RL168_787, partial [Bacteroidota bacterium]
MNDEQMQALGEQAVDVLRTIFDP